jgi:hypothetical protein
VCAQPDTINRLCEPSKRDVRVPAVGGVGYRRCLNCSGDFSGHRCSGSRDKSIVRPSPSADVKKGDKLVLESDDLPHWQLAEAQVGLDTTHCHSTGPSVRNCSSHRDVTQHGLRLVGARSARVFHRHCRFGEGPRKRYVMMIGWDQRQRADLNTMHITISGILDMKKR